MTTKTKAAYFDSIAELWDGWEDTEALHHKLCAGLEELGLSGDERVVDIGCGTGNLTRALLSRLSGRGGVFAVDISSKMIDVARSKISDNRARFHVGDAMSLPLEDGSAHRAICYSVWPHFEDKPSISSELHRVLKPGGCLHIWHLLSKERINEIHRAADDSVSRDLLPPAEETARLLALFGFKVVTVLDDSEHYLVTAVKEE